MLNKLWPHLSKQRKKQFWWLLILMITTSFFEVVSIGAVLPFLAALTSPDVLYQEPLMQPIIQILEISNPDQLIIPLTILFITASLLAGAIRLLLLYVITKLSFAVGADLSIESYRRTLYQEYSIHVSRNSSEVINSIITKTSAVASGVFLPTLQLISSGILLIGVLGALFLINAKVSISASIGFGVAYCMIIYFTKSRLKKNSIVIAKNSTLMVKSLQEGLGGIRDVLINSAQNYYSELYRNADLPLRRASAANTFIGGSPRYAMEAIGVTIIALFACLLTLQDEGIAGAIPILGALALGAQRLLPALQQSYSAYSSIKGSAASFNDVLVLLNQPVPDYIEKMPSERIRFDKEITISNLSFRHANDSPYVLKNIDFSIPKGSHIGFVGVTGSGKSTLLDIIMGLLVPSEGSLIVDGQLITNNNRRAWQMHIAHVPQNIYLTDGTIEENIAFGIPKNEIDHKKVRKAAEQAHISKIIDSWKDGYQTIVGEQGIRLSGGQKQRIGIARALYKKVSILIFDEATSALDNETEQAIMNEIGELSSELTVLIIAHRLTTLEQCDQIIRLDQNKIIEIGSYRELING